MKTKFKIAFSKSAFCLSVLYSIFILMGKAIMKHTVIDVLWNTKKNIALTTVLFITLTIFFYIIITFLFNRLDKNKEAKENKLYDRIFDNDAFLKVLLIFLLLGLPILIIYFPGPVQWDGLRQLNYYFHVVPWTNHHPAFSTMLMGWCVKLGRMLGSDTLGVFFFTFPQYLFSCSVFSYMLVFMHKRKAPKWLVITTFCFFALNPIWHINGYTLIKDTIFYLGLALFMIETIKYYEGSKNYIPIILSGLLVFLFRNNGFHILFITFTFLFLTMKDKRFINLIFVIGIILTQMGYNKILKINNIPKGNIHEALSVPLQQTARYILHYDDYSLEEIKLIERLFNQELKEIAASYNPEISDPIKYGFAVSGNKDLIAYFKLWYKGLCNHPKIYIDAFLENYYGYIYPFRKEYKDGLAYFTIENNPRVDRHYFTMKMSKKFEGARNILEKSIYSLREKKGIELFFNTGTYSWILIFFIFYALRKRRYKAFIIGLPCIVIFLFLFLSPVNAYVRYMNPVVVTMPILICYILTYQDKKNKTN